MSTLADKILTDVLSRIRDPDATMVSIGTPPSTGTGGVFVYAMMTNAQLFVSLAERLITNSQTISLTANTALYDLNTLLGNDYAGKIISCRVPGGYVIDGPVDYQALARASFTW